MPASPLRKDQDQLTDTFVLYVVCVCASVLARARFHAERSMNMLLVYAYCPAVKKATTLKSLLTKKKKKRRRRKCKCYTDRGLEHTVCTSMEISLFIVFQLDVF